MLGELLIGVLLGNLGLLGYSGFEPLKENAMLEIFSRLGVLVLLFEVGLESTGARMLKVEITSAVVAVVGAVTPFVLGWGVGAWLFEGPYHLGASSSWYCVPQNSHETKIAPARTVTDLLLSVEPQFLHFSSWVATSPDRSIF